jgi:hypothetical protein
MRLKEINDYRKKLVDTCQIANSGERNKKLLELRAELGASGCGRDTSTGERDAENIAGINQALQTETMIEMCRITDRNVKVAIIATIIALISALAAWTAVLI